MTTQHDWQPIETAPKDRTIIGANAGHRSITLVHWFEADDDSPAGFFTDEECFGPIELSHWMPLPEPPEPAA